MDEKSSKLNALENLSNNRNRQSDSDIIRCSSIPTAPIIENYDDSAYSITMIRNPPPYSPPNPPQSEYAEPFLTKISRKKSDKSRQWRQCDTDTVFKIALFEGLIAAFMLAGGIWCLCDLSEYCPYYSGIWTSIIFIINALIGMITAKRCTINFFVTHLVLSLISLMLCTVSATISARNWFLIGTYRHPKIDRNQAFCLIGEYDTSRMRYILTQMNRYDFYQCLFQLKLGIAINSIQFIIAIIEVEECLTEQILDHNRCYRWIPLIKINKTTRETFDTDMCKKYGRYSILLESENEWEYIKTVVITASMEAIEKNLTVSTNLYILLGGVERFGRMKPRLLYDEHLKELNVYQDINSSCKRYAVVTQWPKPIEIISVSVQSFSCNELKNYIWNVICKRYCYPNLEEPSTTTTRDFTVYGRGNTNQAISNMFT